MAFISSSPFDLSFPQEWSTYSGYLIVLFLQKNRTKLPYRAKLPTFEH